MLIYLIFSFIAGYILAYVIHTQGESRQTLKTALQRKTEELASYQNQVSQHFYKTSELLEGLQIQQDKILVHLREGSQLLRHTTDSLNSPPNESLLQEISPKDYWPEKSEV